MAQLVYMTAPDRDTAERLAGELVERRLAAGVNVLPDAWSVYRWQGQVRRHGEVLLLAQTADDRVDELVRAVAELHPYETPCVVHWPLAGGHSPFLDWVDEATR